MDRRHFFAALVGCGAATISTPKLAPVETPMDWMYIDEVGLHFREPGAQTDVVVHRPSRLSTVESARLSIK